MTSADGPRVTTGVRPGLVATLIILVVLVAALVLFLMWATHPLGAPDSDADLGGLTWVRSIYGYGDAPHEQFAQPTDVAIGPDGSIWGTDPVNGRVLGFTPSGDFIRAIEATTQQGNPHFVRPEGVGTDESGNVFVADFGLSRVFQFDAEGQPVRDWPVPNPLDVDARDGRIVVSTVYGVAVFDTDSELTDKWGRRGRGEDEFDIAHGVAIADDGTVYVADSQNARIKALSPQGDLIWMSPSSEATEGEVPFQLPSGIAIDGAGRIVLADPFEFSLKVVDPEDGRVISTHGTHGAADGELFYPTGIAYDETRDWFAIADTSNDRLQIVRIPDSGGGILESGARLFLGPGWVWILPPLFLLLAVTLLVISRRRITGARPLTSDTDATDGTATLSDPESAGTPDCTAATGDDGGDS